MIGILFKLFRCYIYKFNILKCNNNNSPILNRTSNINSSNRSKALDRGSRIPKIMVMIVVVIVVKEIVIVVIQEITVNWVVMDLNHLI